MSFRPLMLLVLCIALVTLLPFAAHAVVPTQEQPVVVLRALDKMTARVEEIGIPVGKTIQFGNLSIVAKTCRTTLPEETPPESATYLEGCSCFSRVDVCVKSGSLGDGASDL